MVLILTRKAAFVKDLETNDGEDGVLVSNCRGRYLRLASNVVFLEAEKRECVNVCIDCNLPIRHC